MTRRLVGGPVDGLSTDAPAGQRVVVAVPCPWGGDVYHFAEAIYGADDRWFETVCRSTDDGHPLRQSRPLDRDA